VVRQLTSSVSNLTPIPGGKTANLINGEGFVCTRPWGHTNGDMHKGDSVQPAYQKVNKMRWYSLVYRVYKHISRITQAKPHHFCSKKIQEDGTTIL